MNLSEKILELKNISKKRGDRQILKNVSFSIDKGEIYGFVGRNGAGKSTTIKIITGMLFPDEGEVIICGQNLQKRREALRNIGVIIENPEMYSYMTGRQNLNYISSLVSNVTKSQIEELIKFSKLGSKIDDKVKSYSLGMKQRLGLAQSLMGNISILILDEPTNGLDPIGVIELKNTINTLVKEKGLTVFISSHILSEIESMCDKVIFIDNGKIISVEKIRDNLIKDKNIKNMYIKTNSPQKALEIVGEIPNLEVLKVDSDCIVVSIYNNAISNSEMLIKLSEHKIPVESFYEIKETLEEKFKNIVGDKKYE